MAETAASGSQMEGNGTPQSKIPKAIVVARQFVGSGNVAVSDLDKIPKNTYSIIGTQFRASLTQAQKEKYKTMPAEARRGWIAQFISDPQIGKKRGFHEVKATDSKKTVDEEHWLLETQLASPAWFNSDTLAHLLCESGELESRPSKYEVFAKKGLKEFKITKAMLQRFTGWEQNAGVVNEAEVSAGEFASATAAILDTGEELFGQKGKKQKPTPKPKPDTPESKALREAVTARATQLRKCKVLYDKVERELQEFEAAICKLAEKGYPSQMQEFLRQKAEPVQDIINGVRQFYATEIAKPKGSAETIQEVSATTSSAEEKHAALENAFGDLKKKHINDVVKLKG